MNLGQSLGFFPFQFVQIPGFCQFRFGLMYAFYDCNVFLQETFQGDLSGAEECNIGWLGKLKYLERSPRESNRILRTPHMGKPDQLNQKITACRLCAVRKEAALSAFEESAGKKHGKYAGRHLRKRMFFLSRLFISILVYCNWYFSDSWNDTFYLCDRSSFLST